MIRKEWKRMLALSMTCIMTLSVAAPVKAAEEEISVQTAETAAEVQETPEQFEARTGYHLADGYTYVLNNGLLHISEMSWGRVENPKKIFKVGDPIKVLIKDINGDKIALSLKFEDQNPWLNADEKYAVGNVVEGTIARMTDFGAFVELEPGVDALLHVSQISREHVEKPSDVLSVGQVITAKVVDFNGEEKKISLSMKALEPAAEEAAEEE